MSNSIWAQVSNAPQFDVLPTARDLNIYGGLYRSVELIVTEQTHIAVDHYASSGVYVQQKSVLPDRAEIETVVRVEGASGQGPEGRYVDRYARGRYGCPATERV